MADEQADLAVNVVARASALGCEVRIFPPDATPAYWAIVNQLERKTTEERRLAPSLYVSGLSRPAFANRNAYRTAAALAGLGLSAAQVTREFLEEGAVLAAEAARLAIDENGQPAVPPLLRLPLEDFLDWYQRRTRLEAERAACGDPPASDPSPRRLEEDLVPDPEVSAAQQARRPIVNEGEDADPRALLEAELQAHRPAVQAKIRQALAALEAGAAPDTAAALEAAGLSPEALRQMRSRARRRGEAI